MTMRLYLFALAVALFGGSPLSAQVIEIDSNGTARTFDGPTVFSANRATSIAPKKSKPLERIVKGELIAETARSHGLDPALLQALAWQESRGRMSAVSIKGALGIMQLMPGTAAELRVDPLNASDNIRGGALYLRRQLDRFGGNVQLALAAYNAGPGAVVRYGGIPPYRETQDYVARILGKWQALRTNLAVVPLTIEAAR